MYSFNRTTYQGVLRLLARALVRDVSHRIGEQAHIYLNFLKLYEVSSAIMTRSPREPFRLM